MIGGWPVLGYIPGGGGREVTERSVSTRSNKGQVGDKGRLKETVIAWDGDRKGSVSKSNICLRYIFSLTFVE